jgi:deoxyribonuclease-1-like protein
MFSFKKRYVVMVGVLGGFAIANQDLLKTTWHRLNSETANGSLLASRQSVAPLGNDPKNGAWDSEVDSIRTSFQSVSVQPNSSIDPSLEPLPNSSRPASRSSASPSSTARTVSSSNRTLNQRHATDPLRVRIASFNLNSFGESKVQKLAVVESIAKLIRLFDVVAIQHIQSRQHNILPDLIDKVNQSDRRYEYCIGPRVGPEGAQQQFAFVFDSDRMETDRQMLYTVEDPQQLMSYEPLVGWFRTKTVSASEAFTFSLVNVRIDPLNEVREREALPDLVRSVRKDGRLEDDTILAGDFGCADKELSTLRNAGMLFALEGIPTTVTGEAMLDNIIFPSRATDEFTGRAGVIDFLRQANLSIDQAFQISTHLPVWAEFTATEGGVTGK